jgi:predicted solute-binding protein
MHEKIERMKNEVEEPNKEQIEESSETDKEYSNVEDIIEQIKNATKKEKRIINSYLEKVIVDYIMEHEDLSELNDSTYKNKMNALEKIILLFNTISNSIQTKTKTKTE